MLGHFSSFQVMLDHFRSFLFLVVTHARGLVIVAFNPSVPQKVDLSTCPWTITFTQRVHVKESNFTFLASTPIPLNTGVPSECTETNLILHPSIEVTHLSMSSPWCYAPINYQNPHPRVNVFCSLQLKDQMIKCPLPGDTRHSQILWGCLTHPPPPPGLTLTCALSMKKMIYTRVKSMFICCLTNYVGADNW